eukprot:scpid109187/ scgid30022/ 
MEEAGEQAETVEQSEDVEQGEVVEQDEAVGQDEAIQEEENEFSAPAVIGPFRFEPQGPPEVAQAIAADAAEDDTHIPDAVQRIGHTRWCGCLFCKTMLREAECFCCRESAVALAFSEGEMC